MRGPEEAMNSDAQSLPTEEGSEKSDGRDPCSSPPCKRLKQAVLNFNSNTSLTSGCSSTSSCLSSSPKLSNGITSEVIVIDDEDRTPNCGGLVTAAPSPPDKAQHKTQVYSAGDSNRTSSSTATNDVEKQQIIQNFTIPITKMNYSPQSSNTDILCSPKQTSTDNNKTPLKPTSAEKKKGKEETQKVKEEKQKVKEEKEKQRLEAKAMKEKEKIEAKEKKEQERLEKQAEKGKKEKDKLEKKQKEDKEKQEKKDKKEEERRKKEEETTAKFEEKRKKEEEKKQQEVELERKKKQASISFKNFFTKTTTALPKTLPKAVLKFEPFEIKPDMSLAPVVRMQLSKDSQESLNELMKEQSGISLYVTELQKRKPLPPCRREKRCAIAPKTSNQEEPMEINDKKDKNDSIEISDDESSRSSSIMEIQHEEKKRMSAIFLKFHENNRPPYYGTQQKKSKNISARNPFKKDVVLLNYEVDSDDEWEEEEPGESLSDDSDGEDDDAGGEDNEEEDDGFMVPHGYLSDDEGIDADDEENEEGSNSRQEQQLAKVKAWEAELNKKYKAKRPVCIGCVWPDDKNINEILQQFEACVLVDGPAIAIHTTSSSADSSHSGIDAITATPDSLSKGGMYVPEEAIPDLITLIHRSTAGVVKLIDYFKQHWSRKCENAKAHLSLAGKGHISKRQLEAKIKAIATKERRNDKARWYVHSNVLAAYGLTRLEETENEQLNGKSCSPVTINTGIPVLKPELLRMIKNQNSVSQMRTSSQQMTISNTQCNQLLLSATTLSATTLSATTLSATTLSEASTVQTLQNHKESSVMPSVKRRVSIQPIPKPDAEDVKARENPAKPLLFREQCHNVEEASTKALPSMDKPEQGTADHSLLDGLVKNSSTVTNNIISPYSAKDVAVVTSDAGCLSLAVKRTAPSPVGTDRAAKVPRKSIEQFEIIPIASDVIRSVSVQMVDTLDKTNMPVAQVLPQPSKETIQETTGQSLVSGISKLGSSSNGTLECTPLSSVACITGDEVKPMEIEQIAKA